MQCKSNPQSMKKILIFILFATLTQCLVAQNAKIDSLKRVIETTRVDTVKGRALCRLCDEFRKVGDYQAALKQGQDGLSLCKAKTDAKGEAGCLNSIGAIYFLQGDYPKA